MGIQKVVLQKGESVTLAVAGREPGEYVVTYQDIVDMIVQREYSDIVQRRQTETAARAVNAINQATSSAQPQQQETPAEGTPKKTVN